jgi:hypothetical protein
VAKTSRTGVRVSVSTIVIRTTTEVVPPGRRSDMI